MHFFLIYSVVWRMFRLFLMHTIVCKLKSSSLYNSDKLNGWELKIQAYLSTVFWEISTTLLICLCDLASISNRNTKCNLFIDKIWLAISVF
jgi:hypothetical protein